MASQLEPGLKGRFAKSHKLWSDDGGALQEIQTEREYKKVGFSLLPVGRFPGSYPGELVSWRRMKQGSEHQASMIMYASQNGYLKRYSSWKSFAADASFSGNTLSISHCSTACRIWNFVKIFMLNPHFLAIDHIPHSLTTRRRQPPESADISTVGLISQLFNVFLLRSESKWGGGGGGEKPKTFSS